MKKNDNAVKAALRMYKQAKNDPSAPSSPRKLFAACYEQARADAKVDPMDELYGNQR